jgi:hypothetical protein
LDLLWELSLWHALAKLRLHTETTVTILEATTTNLGTAVRRFEKSCRDIDTRELPKEVVARTRRDAKANTSGRKGKQAASGSKKKTLNLKTFKWHAIGHLPHFIRRHGTSDSYSTQVVRLTNVTPMFAFTNYKQGELEHRRVKMFYIRTNRIRFAQQIAARTCRQRLLNSIHQRGAAEHQKKKESELLAAAQGVSASLSSVPMQPSEQPRKRGRPRKPKTIGLGFEEKDPLPATSFTAHHHMSESNAHHLDITEWLGKHREDPALKVRHFLFACFALR